MQDPSNPWNIPDWRDPANYPPKDGTPIHRWRWEFLRRHEPYRTVWAEFNTNRAAWLAVGDDKPARHDLEAKRFNLSYLINPAWGHVIDELEIFTEQIGTRVMPACYVAEEVGEFVENAARRGLYLAAIDPEAPIDAQLELIKDETRAWTEELSSSQASAPQPRKRGDAWQLYLRLLDAREYKKATWGQIEHVLKREMPSRSKDSIRTTFDAAQACRERFATGVR